MIDTYQITDGGGDEPAPLSNLESGLAFSNNYRETTKIDTRLESDLIHPHEQPNQRGTKCIKQFDKKDPHIKAFLGMEASMSRNIVKNEIPPNGPLRQMLLMV